MICKSGDFVVRNVVGIPRRVVELGQSEGGQYYEEGRKVAWVVNEMRMC